jgi:hypothetical protein
LAGLLPQVQTVRIGLYGSLGLTGQDRPAQWRRGALAEVLGGTLARVENGPGSGSSTTWA